MSLSSEKIYKRKTSTINRQNLLNALFGKYIKTVHCGALSTNTKFNDRQLIRYEYFNDIQACLMNYCQLTENRNASGSKDERKSCLRNTDKRKSVKRTASVSFKKNKIIGGIGGASGSDGAKPNLRSTSKGRDCDDSEQEDEAEGEDARKLGQQSSCSMTVTRTNEKASSDNEGRPNRMKVELKREPGASFGVSIVGGTVNISNDGQQISGIFIKNIIPSSPAELCKQLKVGDRILSVNGEDVRNSTQEYAINLVKNAGSSIVLEMQSFDINEIKKEQPANENYNKDAKPRSSILKHSAPVASVKNAVETANNADPKPINVNDRFSDDEEDDSEDEDSLGKVVTKLGKEIDRKSAGNVKRSRDEISCDEEPENEYGYTDKKIKKRYGHLGKIVRQKINRSNNSLGIALAGHRNRNEMGCFIVGVNPKGSVNLDQFNIGDELLEINGIVLHKMCHLNASTMIKGIPGNTFEFLLLRKDDGKDSMAVPQVTNFPAAFDQFDQLHSCYKNVRNVTIQKIGPSLGIMIIEGKHSELGQGIFISDIQDNSNAEKAGLLIGEMILAVNKDLLIDCNYDTAATLLKRAEGIVTLTVCNPNKKGDGTDESITAVAKEDAKPKKESVKKPPEPPADPLTAAVVPNKDVVIEINGTGFKALGLFIIGGKMLEPPEAAAYVVMIFPDGAAKKDGRLQVFDRISEIEGKKLTAEMSSDEVRKLFRHANVRAKMTVYRSEPSPTTEIDIEITRKPGKEIGIGFIECKEYGILVTDIVAGSVAALDNRLLVGDIIVSINGDDVRNASFIDCALLMKAAANKVTLKVLRLKSKK